MAKTEIRTDQGAAPSGAYSQGSKVGDFIFVSGQGPLDPATGEVVGATIEEQTARTLQNIKAILEAGGATMADVVRVTPSQRYRPLRRLQPGLCAPLS
jgi:2-iminobutanoate/2-iminopropanoate deaminase